MGLDMYLTKETFIGAEYEHRKVKGKIKVSIYGEAMPIQFENLDTITEKAGYWRKANQIHKWFVDNVQGGKDECEKFEVSKEQLNDLLNTCRKAKADHSLVAELLPPQEGFFFGGSEIDGYYWGDIDYTIKLIEPILANWPNEGGKNYPPEYFYRSSW